MGRVRLQDIRELLPLGSFHPAPRLQFYGDNVMRGSGRFALAYRAFLIQWR